MSLFEELVKILEEEILKPQNDSAPQVPQVPEVPEDQENFFNFFEKVEHLQIPTELNENWPLWFDNPIIFLILQYFVMLTITNFV